jgi:hypothetical protein
MASARTSTPAQPMPARSHLLLQRVRLLLLCMVLVCWLCETDMSHNCKS